MSESDATARFQEHLSRLRHDMRTPVGHIIGYAEILNDDVAGMSSEFVRDLHAIKTSGERIVALIDEYFGAARTSVEELELKDAQYRLRVQLDQISGYGELLREHAIESKREDLLPDLDRICAAAKKLVDFVSLNLVPSSFADRAEADRKEAAKSAGLTDEQSLPADPASATSWLGEGGDVLIVDDDASNRDLLSRRLSRSGYTTECAESGEAALELLGKRSFDLVLLDLLMPGLSGLETLERIKAEPRLRATPVIMLSAADNMDQMVQCVLKGADDYLFKPFNPVLLRARIRAALEKVRLRRQFAERIKVFISSPGDVIPERRIVKSVISALNEEYAGEVTLTPILWEEEPLLASETFQSQIHSPHETDIYIGILWSRLGSVLPDSIRRADGSRYESGTAFEFEDAMAGFRSMGKPEMLVYRKEGAPTLTLNDRNEVLDRLEQMDRLQAYIDRWFRGDDGSYLGALHTFSDPDQFETLVTLHLTKLVEKIRERR